MLRILLFIALIASSMLSLGQNVNQIIFNEMANQNILYGKGTVEVFSQEPFNVWYTPEFESYIPNQAVIDSIKPLLQGVSAKLVLATWCKDSKREVPRFFKIFMALDAPLDSITVIGVDRKKVCPEEGVEAGYVEFVPTIFFYRDGEEIGRFVEHPKVSLESDILSILQGKYGTTSSENHQ